MKNEEFDLKPLFKTYISNKSTLKVLEKACEKREEREGGLARVPFVKSRYTCDLELLFKSIISGEEVTISITENPPEYRASLKNNDGIKEFNLSEILRYANLNLITVSEKEMDQYEHYTRNVATFDAKPQKNRHKMLVGFSAMRWPDRKYFNRDEVDDEYGEREEKDDEGPTYAEKLAINIYTGPFHEKMNALLRGKVIAASQLIYKQQEIKDALVNSVMAISGLNKLPDQHLDVAYRGESTSCKESEKMLSERILKAEASEMSSVTSERGFISTSSMGETCKKGNIYTLFIGLIGKSVGKLSQNPSEGEFLMPPTQVSWVKHQADPGRIGVTHYFLAKPVRTLKNLAPEAQEMPPAPKISEMELYLLEKKHSEEQEETEKAKLKGGQSKTEQDAESVQLKEEPVIVMHAFPNDTLALASENRDVNKGSVHQTVSVKR